MHVINSELARHNIQYTLPPYKVVQEHVPMPPTVALPPDAIPGFASS